MSVTPQTQSPENSAVPPSETNTVAVVGVVLVGLTIFLCGLLFWLVSQLPSGIDDFRTLKENTPAQMRLLVLGCSTAVLALVSLVVCLFGSLLPNRPRLLASVGALISAMILLGVFGVLIVGAVLNPSEVPVAIPEAVEPLTAEDADG